MAIRDQIKQLGPFDEAKFAARSTQMFLPYKNYARVIE
jgi:hypothetical protein